jgi:hypothetical protein
LTLVAGGLFNTIQSINKYKPNPSFTPKMVGQSHCSNPGRRASQLSDGRVPPIRCVPNCVIEAREAILSGKKDVSVLINEKVGEIKAQIIERDGQIWMDQGLPGPRPL